MKGVQYRIVMYNWMKFMGDLCIPTEKILPSNWTDT